MHAAMEVPHPAAWHDAAQAVLSWWVQQGPPPDAAISPASVAPATDRVAAAPSSARSSRRRSSVLGTTPRGRKLTGRRQLTADNELLPRPRAPPAASQ